MKNQIIDGDSLEVLKTLENDSVDLVVTDPPYGYSFMGKDWDKAVPSVEVWKECLRVLKPGAFAFIMSAPRQDVLSQMIVRIGEAGFKTEFTSLYWTYASGFPKAMNIGKMVDKRGGQYMGWFADFLKEELKKRGMTQKELAKHFPSKTGGLTGCVHNWTEGKNIPTPEQFNKICEVMSLPFENIQEAEREVIGKQSYTVPTEVYQVGEEKDGIRAEALITAPKTSQAKALEGSYGGFQPKPAVEVIIVAMKPLSEKTYVDQALKNGKGITWLDDARIPFEDTQNPATNPKFRNENGYKIPEKGVLSEGNVPFTSSKNEFEPKGRFPANLLVSDDVLNGEQEYSRYFDLDKWASTLPFLITPKASKSEKNRGLDSFPDKLAAGLPMRSADGERGGEAEDGSSTDRVVMTKNFHPTVKPLKLMSYLITLGSREGDTVLDPFAGSCTTCVACKEMKRNYIGIEREEEYVKICEARLSAIPSTLFQ